MARDVVFCIGDENRAGGTRVAKLLDGRLPERCLLVALPALDIEMMDELPDAGTLVFVAAESRGHPPVDVRPVEPEPHGEFGHALSPGQFLDIAWSIFACRPKAWLVTVAAMEDAPPGDRSAAEEEAAEAVLRLLGAGQ
jgi:hypothetical protein